MVCQAGSARLHWRDVRLRHANRWPDARLQMSHLILVALRPALAAFSCRAQSLLVLGKPGTGKTTLLRDIARIMSTPPQQGGLGLAVLIVDTSNEIAGGPAQLVALPKERLPYSSQQPACKSGPCMSSRRAICLVGSHLDLNLSKFMRIIASSVLSGCQLRPLPRMRR